MNSTQPRGGQAQQTRAAGTLPPLPPTAQPKASATAAGHSARAVAACTDYGHAKLLPDYKLLAIPRTNNYYAAVGGCPCIPRRAARPGSYRLRAAQLRSTTNEYRTHCHHMRSARHNHHAPTTTNTTANTTTTTRNTQPMSHTNCTKKERSGAGGEAAAAECPGCAHGHYYAFGWRPGPHTVHAKNTAATGKCDTFGNLAFKSRRFAGLGNDEDDEDVLSEAGPEKLADLETLVLEEHAARVRLESDIAELKAIAAAGSAESYKQTHELQQRQRRIAAASDDDLDALLRDVRTIVDRPLHQVNMDLLRRIIRRHEQLQRKRDYIASLEKLREGSDESGNSNSGGGVAAAAAEATATVVGATSVQ